MSDNSFSIEVSCPYCGELQQEDTLIEKTLGYTYDATTTCQHCGKLFVFVTRVMSKTYTVNIPDEEIPREVNV